MEPTSDTPQQTQNIPQTPIMEQPQQEMPPVIQKTSSPKTLLLVVVGVILLTVVGAGAYYMGMQNAPQVAPLPKVVEDSDTSDEIVCTMDAKICPDGSSVGRSGPNCEFEACPSSATTNPKAPEENETSESNLQMYQNLTHNYKVEYPAGWNVLDSDTGQAATDSTRNVTITDSDLNSTNHVEIEYAGMLQDTSLYEKVTRNSMTMYAFSGADGDNYYVNIPDTDQFLYILGGDSHPEIFNSFAFLIY